VAVAAHRSASYSLTVRAEIPHEPGQFANVAAAIGDADAILGAIDLVRVDAVSVTRDITVLCGDETHGERVVEAIRALPGIQVVSVSDRTFLMHKGGKIEMQPKVPIRTRDDLSMAYTPGVARISNAIAEFPDRAWTLTAKGNTVAVVTDGSAVLGLGDIGPEAALPVMEGKAMLFKEFADVDAWPICLATQDVDEIVRTTAAIAPGFGGINLEDISAPRCFEIERRLQELLDIPVFHDDQHGTAIVVLSAFRNALRLVEKEIGAVRVAVVGTGAAGTAVTEILLAAGVRRIVGCDVDGIVYRERPGLTPALAEYANRTNPDDLRGSIADAVAGADVVIGLSRPGVIDADMVRSMAPNPIVFAMANPTPEIAPEEIEGVAAVIATGRSDYPNQINNVLAFPGIFRGALDVRARRITAGMKLAAARAIADVIAPEELAPEYIVPSVFNKEVVEDVARAVAEAAVDDGVHVVLCVGGWGRRRGKVRGEKGEGKIKAGEGRNF
jgi:malate dehydrogenase (oxaloacetate-decarboxylating)